jgi:dienelactone hydrolase
MFDVRSQWSRGSDAELDTLTPRDHLSDITAAYDALVAEPAVDPSRIGVCGASYGAYLAVLLAGRRTVSQLLLRAPAMYGDEEFNRPLGQRRQSRVTDSAAMLMSSLAAFDGQMLVVESGADEVIPPEVISAYLAACTQARHLILAGATHHLGSPVWRQRFLEAILNFFREL